MQSEFLSGGAGIGDEQWQLMVCASDEDGDGEMSLHEFQVVMNQLSSGDISYQEAAVRCAQGAAGCSFLVPL